MSVVADLEKIKHLLQSEITAYQIETDTGITRTSISNYRTGKSDILKMPFWTAIKLTNYYDHLPPNKTE